MATHQWYRRRARGPAVGLLYDPARIEPKNWLTERLGEVVLLPPAGEEIEAREADALPAPASPSFVEYRIGDGFGGPPRDARVVPNELIESQGSFPEDEWDFEEVEERLAIMTIDGGLTEDEARAALGLVEATRRWIERCGGARPGATADGDGRISRVQRSGSYGCVPKPAPSQPQHSRRPAPSRFAGELIEAADAVTREFVWRAGLDPILFLFPKNRCKTQGVYHVGSGDDCTVARCRAHAPHPRAPPAG